MHTLIGLALLVGVGYFAFRGGDFSPAQVKQPQLFDVQVSASPGQSELCGASRPNQRPVVVEMLYSEDTRAWIEFAADRYSRLCPNIQIKPTAMEDVAAINEILSGKLHPTVWAPADELSLRYLDYRWFSQTSRHLYLLDDKRELVASPLVLLIWEDRLRVLSTILRRERSSEGQWVRGMCPLVPRVPTLTGLPVEAMVPGKWADWYASPLPESAAVQPGAEKEKGRRKRATEEPAAVLRIRPPGDGSLPDLETLRTWGRVKIGHPWPTRHASGAAVLYLMAHGYVLPPMRGETAEQLGSSVDPAAEPEDAPLPSSADDAEFEQAWASKKSDFAKWLRRCEAGLETSPLSTLELPTSMVNQGPAKWDAVITYEHLALLYLERADTYSKNLLRMAVIYPRPTLVARHPAVVFPSDPAQQDAAQRWLRFLQSKPMQYHAITLGFRPTNPEVSLRDPVVEMNDFLRLRRYGISPAPRIIEPPLPRGAALNELILLWGDTMGRK